MTTPGLLSSSGARFVVVGSAAALLLFVSTFGLVALGLPAFGAGLLAYAVSFAFAYTAQRSWAFAGAASHRRAFPRYLVLQAGSALFSGTITHLGSVELGLPPMAVAAATTIAASAVSYVVSSRWVFVKEGRAS